MNENEPKHTPGPWEVQRAFPRMTEIWQAHAGRTTSYHVARALAAIPGFGNEDSPPVEHAEANARLIAAAPELLEVSKRFRAELADVVGMCAGDAELARLLADVDAAIAKATGKEAKE